MITEAAHYDISSNDRYHIRYLGLFELRNITGVNKIYEVLSEEE